MYVTSRGFLLPETEAEMGAAFWFNMWTKRLWPYKELQTGDILYWYETPTKSVKWRTEVSQIETFEYSDKQETATRLEAMFQSFDEQQDYFKKAPSEGFCLAWTVRPLEKLDLERPEDFRFAPNGWMRVEDIKGQWPELAV